MPPPPVPTKVGSLPPAHASSGVFGVGTAPAEPSAHDIHQRGLKLLQDQETSTQRFHSEVGTLLSEAVVTLNRSLKESNTAVKEKEDLRQKNEDLKSQLQSLRAEVGSIRSAMKEAAAKEKAALEEAEVIKSQLQQECVAHNAAVRNLQDEASDHHNTRTELGKVQAALEQKTFDYDFVAKEWRQEHERAIATAASQARVIADLEAKVSKQEYFYESHTAAHTSRYLKFKKLVFDAFPSAKGE
jgi:chromosome segregation ATPase